MSSFEGAAGGPAPASIAAVEGLLGTPAGVRLAGVERVHRMGDVAVPALRGVDVDIRPGEFVALVGPSGCGKSTLLSLVGGLDRPTAGDVVVGGVSLGRLPDRRLADYRLQRVGTIFQSFNLVPTLSALDNVALPMALAGVPHRERIERAGRLLEIVGLGARAGFRPTRLSGGEQQRVAVARALANRPGLLLADEPTGNLDSQAGLRVLELIKGLHAAGATVLMVTHDRDVAAAADRVIALRDGQVVEDPAPPAGGPALTEAEVRRPGRLGLLQSLWMGVAGVRRRKLRTGLSSGGVAVGIIAVALILSLVTGIQSSLLSAFAQVGQLQRVTVAYGERPAADLNRKHLDQAAVDQMARLPHASAAYGSVALSGSAIVNGSRLPAAYAFSMDPRRQTPKTAGKLLTAGRLPASDDAAEALAGPEVLAKAGLRPAQALGAHLIFYALFSGLAQPGAGVAPAADQRPLEVTIVGLLGNAGGGGLASLVLPYGTATRYWRQMADANHWLADEFQSIAVIADDARNVDRLRDEVKKLGYPAQSGSDQVRQVSSVFLFLGLALSAFGAIALFVASLGIANTMYTAVLERTREIGILKAIGARSGDVLAMFVAEAATVGVLGGVIGLAVTALLAAIGNVIVSNLARQQGFGLDIAIFQIPLWLIFAAIGLAALISALAGLAPAIRASRLNPVLALRYE